MARNISKVFYLILTTVFLSILFVECKKEAPKLIDDDSSRQLKQGMLLTIFVLLLSSQVLKGPTQPHLS